MLQPEKMTKCAAALDYDAYHLTVWKRHQHETKTQHRQQCHTIHKQANHDGPPRLANAHAHREGATQATRWHPALQASLPAKRCTKASPSYSNNTNVNNAQLYNKIGRLNSNVAIKAIQNFQCNVRPSRMTPCCQPCCKQQSCQ